MGFDVVLASQVLPDCSHPTWNPESMDPERKERNIRNIQTWISNHLNYAHPDSTLGRSDYLLKKLQM